MERKRVVSLVDSPQGSLSGLERPGKKDDKPSRFCSQPSYCIPTAAPAAVVLPQKTRGLELGEGLERRWQLGILNSPPVLSLALRAKLSHCVTYSISAQETEAMRGACLPRCTGKWLGEEGIWGRFELRSPAYFSSAF